MRKLWFIPLLITVVSACQKTEDTEGPVVEVESPTENQVIVVQEGLQFRASITDNTGLLQYKLVIFGIDSLNVPAQDSTYFITYIDALPSEQFHLFEQTLNLPDSTFNGFYAAIFSCLDVEGNESVKDTIRFELLNNIDSEPPQFNVTGPTVSDTLGFGQGFTIQGTTTDSQSLIYSDIYVGRTNGSDTTLFFQFSEPVNNTIDYNSIGWYLEVDSTWAQGDYHIYITAWDNYSGRSHTIPFHVKY